MIRSGKTPEIPSSLTKPEIAFREHVKAVLKRARRDGKRGQEIDVSGLDAEEADFVRRTAHLPEDVDLTAYCKAWLKVRQRFAMPRVRDEVGALLVMLSQPEVLDMLGRWLGLRNSTGPRPSYSGSKAVMLAMSALGKGPHVKQGHFFLFRNESTQAVCSWALDEAAALVDEPCEPFALTSVENVLKHMPRLSLTLGKLAMRANVKMLRFLAAIYPNLPICQVAGIDGTAVAAWAEQRGGRSEQDERYLRRQATKAGYRSYNRRGGKKSEVAQGETVDAKQGKFWRGYHLVALVDFCTGRPIVWTIVDAALDEARTLHELLRVLYELWPDCPLTTIVGDGAWDENWAHELCERNYGLHLVASRTSDQRKLDAKHDLDLRESEAIAYFDGRGQAFCRAHDKPLDYRGSGLAKRDGLAPGEPTPATQFRLRFRCPHGCEGSPSLQMRRHWTALARYPHHAHGQRSRYSERFALLAHRNVCESLFNALKVRHKLATSGADRLRLTDFDTLRALVDLSFCMGTALMVGHERDQRGLPYPKPWDEAEAA